MVKKNIDQEMQDFKQQKERVKTEQQTNEEGALVEAKMCRDMTPQASEIFQAAAFHERIRIFGGMRKFFLAAEVKAIKEIKETKSFKYIEIDDGEKIRLCGNFSEYCKYVIGRSDSIVYEDIQNHNIFGDAIDGMRNMGVERNDFRLLRKAPDDLQEEARQVAEAGDKDALLEIIDDLATKHAKEKEALENQNSDLKADLEVNRKKVADKQLEIEKLKDQACRRDGMRPDEKNKELAMVIQERTSNITDQILPLRSIVKEIYGWDKAPRDLRHSCAQAIARVRIALDQVQVDFGIASVELDFDDSWVDKSPSSAGEVAEYECE